MILIQCKVKCKGCIRNGVHDVTPSSLPVSSSPTCFFLLMITNANGGKPEMLKPDNPDEIQNTTSITD